MPGNTSIDSSGRVGSGFNYSEFQVGAWGFNRLRYIKEMIGSGPNFRKAADKKGR